MSVPLDRLYNYLKDIIEEIHNGPILIYRFYPHGSKKIEDLLPLVPITENWSNKVISLEIFCNDQEPLNHKLYACSVRPNIKPLTDLCQQNKIDFVKFVDEHDKRRGTNFIETFPELEKMYNNVKNR
jgi:hypothetical protein